MPKLSTKVHDNFKIASQWSKFKWESTILNPSEYESVMLDFNQKNL